MVTMRHTPGLHVSHEYFAGPLRFPGAAHCRREEATDVYRDVFDTAYSTGSPTRAWHVVEPEPPHRIPGAEPTSI